MAFKHNHIVIGGTFDLLHAGHKEFIRTAFNLAKFVSIGITTDSFNKERGKDIYQDQDARKKLFSNYLTKQNLTQRCKIVFINDIFGTSLCPEVDAIIVTNETFKNAQIINSKRKHLTLSSLKIIKLAHSKGADGKIISSTRIRNGEIDSEGRVYKKMLLNIADKQLNQEMIAKLKSPLGIIISEITQTQTPVISVGDAVTQKYLSLHMTPNISIIDLKTHRKKIYNSITQLGFKKSKPDITVINRSGGISKTLVDAVNKAIKQKGEKVILVKGEEDLAVLPAVLLSPFGTKILYGQPEVGIVEIIVSEESKDKICRILNLN